MSTSQPFPYLRFLVDSTQINVDLKSMCPPFSLFAGCLPKTGAHRPHGILQDPQLRPAPCHSSRERERGEGGGVGGSGGGGRRPSAGLGSSVGSLMAGSFVLLHGVGEFRCARRFWSLREFARPSGGLAGCRRPTNLWRLDNVRTHRV